MQKKTDWTLFLDRDGVINKRLDEDYVKSWADFEFLPDVLEALKLLAGRFDRIIVVSNQQGIGKGLMTQEDLRLIHEKMMNSMHQAGARIDGIFHCPDLATAPGNCRKPSPAMAYKARKAYPEIVFERSIMVGDTPSDMEFGRRLGMKTVFIGTGSEYQKLRVPVHAHCQRLVEFARNAEDHID